MRTVKLSLLALTSSALALTGCAGGGDTAAAPATVTVTASPATVTASPVATESATPVVDDDVLPLRRYTYTFELEQVLTSNGIACNVDPRDTSREDGRTSCKLLGNLPVVDSSASTTWWVFADDTVEVNDRNWAEFVADRGDCADTIMGDHWGMSVRSENLTFLAELLGGEAPAPTDRC